MGIDRSFFESPNLVMPRAIIRFSILRHHSEVEDRFVSSFNVCNKANIVRPE